MRESEKKERNKDHERKRGRGDQSQYLRKIKEERNEKKESQ